jgi:hypothetical protein
MALEDDKLKDHFPFAILRFSFVIVGTAAPPQ